MFEINLVPDIKEQAIKAIKLRNLIFFVCIVVAGASVAVLLVLSTIKGGQDIALGNQDAQLEQMSKTLGSFDDLGELLTIQSQLTNLSKLNAKKTTLSRIFNTIDTLLPTNGDKITISELNVNLDESRISFDAQARALVEPKINFNVLNAFKQSMSLMRYDHGRYVDESGAVIPTLCIEERVMENGQVKAIWAKGAEGCDPSNNEAGTPANNTQAQKYFQESRDEPELLEKVVTEMVVNDPFADLKEPDQVIMEAVNITHFTTIYRTPKFTEWYWEGKMDLDGVIGGVPHFESECITYTGIEEEEGGNTTVKWSSDNACAMVPDDILITNAADGRNADGEMVLRFSAVITFEPGVFAFNNKHVLTIGPTGKTDVTDSYLQIENMFEERKAGWEAS